MPFCSPIFTLKVFIWSLFSVFQIIFLSYAIITIFYFKTILLKGLVHLYPEGILHVTEFPSKETDIALTFENQRKIEMNERYIHISIIYKGKLYILQSDICSYEFHINKFSQSQIGNICEGGKGCSDIDIPHTIIT